MSRKPTWLKSSNRGPKLLGQDDVDPFDVRGEKILFTPEIYVENPNEIGVYIAFELDKFLQALERKKSGKSKNMGLEERKISILVINDLAISKGAHKGVLSFGVTNPTINI